MFNGLLNEIAPALFNMEADLAPDGCAGRGHRHGEMAGPSEGDRGPCRRFKTWAVAFPKTSPLLEEAFGRFLNRLWSDGTYLRLVKKYYPAVPGPVSGVLLTFGGHPLMMPRAIITAYEESSLSKNSAVDVRLGDGAAFPVHGLSAEQQLHVPAGSSENGRRAPIAGHGKKEPELSAISLPSVATTSKP